MTHRIRFPLALCLGLAATGALAAGPVTAPDASRADRRAGFLFGLLKGMDDDGDGAISRTELGTKMPAWSTAFTTIDADADGKLQRDELKAHWYRSAQERRAARGENRG